MTLLRIAWRDLSGSMRRSFAFAVIIMLGVTVSTGVRFAAAAFEESLSEQLRAGLAADISVEQFDNPEDSQLNFLDHLGTAQWTLVTSSIVFAQSDQAAGLVPAVIKAVDPRLYPFYGTVELDPPQSLQSALAGRSAVVSNELARELNIGPGKSIRIRDKECRVTAILKSEPDRFAGSFGSSLRVMVSRETLEQTQAVAFGSEPEQRVLVRADHTMSLRKLRHELEKAFPSGVVFDVRDISPPAAGAARTATAFIGLAAWFGFALGAAGAMVMAKLHLESRRPTVFVLKCLGARPRSVCIWLVLELFLLGGAGGLAGGAAGALSAPILVKMARLPVALRWSPSILRFALEGIAVGLLLQTLSAWPWLLATSRLRPQAVLIPETVRARPAYFPRTSAVGHHILSSVFRSGSAMATIAFLIMLMATLVRSKDVIVTAIVRALPHSSDDLYIMRFTDDEAGGVRSILDHDPDVERPYYIGTFAYANVVGTRGPQTWLLNCQVDQRDATLDRETAMLLGVKLGSWIEIAGHVRLAVRNIRQLATVDRLWYSIVVPCSAISGEFTFHHATVRVRDHNVTSLKRELRTRYPALALLTPSDAFMEAERVGLAGSTLTRFIGWIAVCGSALILVAVLASSLRDRSRDIAIFQMLGARRGLLIRILAVEFGMLGSIAGLLGGIAGIVLLDLVLSISLGEPVSSPKIGTILLSTVAGAGIAIVVGGTVCGGLLAAKPLSTFRKSD